MGLVAGILRFLRGSSKKPSVQESAARARNQRVVLSDWAGIWTVGEDGTPYFSERTDLVDQVEVQELKGRNMARALAAERYPDMARFRPVRSNTDLDCSTCGGTGKIALPSNAQGQLICECGGLGWLPAKSSPSDRDAAV
jgi:hypothetical protein